jgi:hypothetical protein
MFFGGLPIELISGGGRAYDITLDGKFIVMERSHPAKALHEQINVALNWFEELKQRVPVY